MKLRKGLNVVIGHKTWSGEIPDKKFEIMTREWPEEKRKYFIESFCEIDKPKSRSSEKSK